MRTPTLSIIAVTAAVALTAIGASAQRSMAPPRTNDGGALFRTYCASCHGVTAQGNGPVAPLLLHKPTDLSNMSFLNGGVFPSARLQRIIDGREVQSHGTPEMPVWGSAFRLAGEAGTEADVKARIEALVKYLETIQQKRAH